MNIYTILMLFIFDNFHTVDSTVLDKGFNMSPCGVGLEFYVNLSCLDCEAELSGDRCCVLDEGDEDCDVVEIVGGCRGFIPKDTKKTFSLIAPLLNPYQRKGYCTLYVDTKPIQTRTNKRDIVIINFDTRVHKNNHNLKACKNKDEDPLNNCKPVDCDSFYNGKKSFYHPKLKRCVKHTECLPNDETTPDVIYNPTTNECNEESITKEDLEFLKELQTKPRRAKDLLILQNANNNTDVIDTYLDEFHIKPNKSKEHRKITPDEYYMKMVMKNYFAGKKGPLFILSLVVSMQCCLICVMMYCLTRTCTCFKDKKVVRKFFNYHQDVSVTTPLINTSNIDTETTDYQFVSESSKVDQKIKCYKACQKEISKNVRPSMSDDILSKCLNRRDWGKHTRSDVIPEGIETHDKDKVITADEKPRVMFDEEDHEQKVDKVETKKTSDKDVEANWSSEREIQCHSYNENVTGFKSSQRRATTFVEQPRKGTISLSTAKGAQACFSNDSIDEYISERGMIYLAGENVSKYTFTDSSELKPSSSSVSSKTSKNFVKHVLSLIQKKSRGHLSDPGGKKDAMGVELLHMSKATVYSSSNESEYKNYRKKDSRTSL